MRISLVATAVVFCSASLAAHADSFAFSFGNAGSTFSGSGLFTVGNPIALGEYLIESVTGTVITDPNGPERTIASILDAGVFPTPTNGDSFPPNDNTLFVTSGIGTLSQDGVSFILTNGAQINLYDDGPGSDALLERTTGKTVSESVPITIGAIASTPEPSSFALLGTGLLSVTGLMRRRLA